MASEAGFTWVLENIGLIQAENWVWIFWVTDSGYLMDKGLINKEQYEQKRTDILKSL